MTTRPQDSSLSGASPPRLLYVGEFPPSNHHGGAILLKRLLDHYPAGCLTVITSRIGMKASQTTGLVDCTHLVLPAFDQSRYFLIGRLISAANWLGLSLVALRTIVEVKRKRVEALLTIVQGRYYFATAFAAWITATPHITIVHDNFTSAYVSPSDPVRKVKRYLTRKILRNAAHIYAVSPEMQRLVSRECGAVSEIQLPSTGAPPRQPQTPHEGGPIILFAGLIGYTVRDSLDLLANLIKTRQLEKHGICEPSGGTTKISSLAVGYHSLRSQACWQVRIFFFYPIRSSTVRATRWRPHSLQRPRITWRRVNRFLFSAQSIRAWFATLRSRGSPKSWTNSVRLPWRKGSTRSYVRLFIENN